VNGVAVTFADLEGVICTSVRCCCNILCVRFPAPSDPPCCLFSSTTNVCCVCARCDFRVELDGTRTTSSHQKQRAAGGSQRAVRSPACALACPNHSTSGRFLLVTQSRVPNCTSYNHINVNVAVTSPLRAAHSCRRAVGSCFALGTFSLPVLAVMTAA